MKAALNLLRWGGVSGLILVLRLGATEAYDSGSERDWKLAAEYSFEDALRGFSARQALATATRWDHLGWAATMLERQPRTRQNVVDAEAAVVALVDEKAGDESEIAARYLLARIIQLHRSEPDATEAARRFRALHADHARHPLGQFAAVKYGLLRLYKLEGAGGPEAFAEVEALVRTLTNADARRELHLTLGRAFAFFGGSTERTLFHLQAALALEISNPILRADTLVAVGNLADEFGDAQRAKEAWNRFVLEFPTDARGYAVRIKLAAVAPAADGLKENRAP